MGVTRSVSKSDSLRMLALALGVGVAIASGAPAHAERPMVVDDAGTLDKGGAKVEFGWARDDETRGMDGAVGYGPVENVEVELGFAQARDREPDPSVRLRGVGAAVKWVPLQADTGLSAGLKLEHARERSMIPAAPDERARVSAVTGLATWGFASGQRLHVNLGREWVRSDDETDVANTWGVGVEHPLNAVVTVAVEVFGVEDGAPDRQIGLRYEIVEGIKISAAIGRGNDRGFGNVGLAWEF